MKLSTLFFISPLLAASALADTAGFSPTLVPPIKKIVTTDHISCAVDAEAMKCWQKGGGAFRDRDRNRLTVVVRDAQDFAIESRGKVACWIVHSALECASLYEQGDLIAPEAWPSLANNKSFGFPADGSSLFCVVVGEKKEQKKICGILRSAAQSDAFEQRYLDDKMNDGEIIEDACEISLTWRHLVSAWYGEYRREPVDVTEDDLLKITLLKGFKLNKNSKISIDGSLWEWTSDKGSGCRGSLSFSYPGLTYKSRRYCPTLSEAFALLPETDCKKRNKSSFASMKKRMDLAAMVSSNDEEWRQIFAAERGMKDVSVYREEINGRRADILSFTAPSGESIKLDMTDSNGLEDVLGSYADFHVYSNDSLNDFQVFDRNWKKLNVKVDEYRVAARRFRLEDQTYTCVRTSCYRAKEPK